MSQTTPHSSVFSGATWYFLEKITRLVGAFLVGAWVARYLGPEMYGALAYVLALVAVLGFLGSFGVESLIVRELVHDNLRQRQIIATYFYTRLIGATLVPLLAVSYLLIMHNDNRLLMVLSIICGGAVIFGAFDAADCWLQAKQKAKVSSSIRMVGFVVGASIKCLLVIGEARVEWFAGAVLVESGVMAALYLRLLLGHGLTPDVSQWSIVEFKRIFCDGKWMVLSALMVTVYSKVDMLAIGTFLSKESLAPYAVAATMVAAWNMVGMSLVQAWAPRISSAIQASNKQYIAELRKMFLVVVGVSVAGSAALSAISDYVFHFLLGQSYSDGIRVFDLLVWSSVFVFLGVATSQIIVNEKIYWISLFRTFVGMIVSLLAIVPVAKSIGVMGVAGLVVSSSAVATLSILFSSSARRTLRRIVFIN